MPGAAVNLSKFSVAWFAKKGRFIVVMVKEAEAPASRDDFNIICCIMKKLSGDRKSFNNPIKGDISQLLDHHDKQVR